MKAIMHFPNYLLFSVNIVFYSFLYVYVSLSQQYPACILISYLEQLRKSASVDKLITGTNSSCIVLTVGYILFH